MKTELTEEQLDRHREASERARNDYKYDGFNEMDQLAPPQRNFFIRTYSDINVVREHLSKNYCHAIKHFHIIEHNADTHKGVHCHIVMVLNGPMRPSAVYNWFKPCYQTQPEENKGKYGNTYVEIPSDIINCYQYLIHANNPEKEPYDPMLIRHYGNPKQCMDAIGLKPEFSTVVRAWNDYKNGMCPDDLINKYGKDFLYHSLAYEKMRDSQYRYQTIKDNLDNISGRFGACSDFLDCARSVVYNRIYEADPCVSYKDDVKIISNKDYQYLWDLVESLDEVINGHETDYSNYRFVDILKKHQNERK